MEASSRVVHFAAVCVLLGMMPLAANAGAFPATGATLGADTIYDANAAWTSGNLDTGGFIATFTNSTTTLSGAASRNIQGTGSVILEQDGILKIDASLLTTWTCPLTVRNGATLNLAANGSLSMPYQMNAGSLITIKNGGRIWCNPPAVNDTNAIQNKFAMVLEDGALVDVDKGTLLLDGGPAAGTIMSPAGTIDVAAGAIVAFETETAQRWGTNGSATTAGMRIIGAGSTYIRAGAFTVDKGWVSLETTGSNLWSGGGINLYTGGEMRLTNGASLYFTSAIGQSIGGDAAPGGKFIVYDGCAFVQASTLLITLMNNNDMEIWSGGEFRFDAAGDLRRNAGCDFTLYSGGRLTHNHGGVSTFTANPGVVDIKNGATVQVLQSGGELQIDPSSAVLFNGAAPTADLGFNVTINNAKLDIDDTANITNISTGVTVTLSGANPLFMDDTTGQDRLTNSLNTINGKLSLRGGCGWRINPSAGTLRAPAAGILEFGLNTPDTKDPSSTTNACLKVNGNVTLADNMTISVVDSGGLNVGEYVIVSASGTLTANESTFSVTFPDGMPDEVSTATLVQEGNDLILRVSGAGSGTVIIFR